MYHMQKELMELGFADTRACSLACAIASLHVAISQLDRDNLKRAARNLPDAVTLARIYAETEGGLNTFDDVK